MDLFGFLTNGNNWVGDGRILDLMGQHLFYTVLAVLLAAVISIPVGIIIGHTGRGGFLVIGSSNAARAIPTLGLLVLVVILLGTGVEKIIPVLAILALPPILTATAAGIGGADREAVHAARAIGLTERQIVGQVEFPLALPLIISGLRSATLQVVATATVAAFAAGGGLGQLLISGQRSNDYPQMFAGAVLIAGLAVLFDVVLGAIGLAVARLTVRRADSSSASSPDSSTSPTATTRSEATT